MKIAILTYHNTLNFGAALQTYSLLRFLQETGNEAEIIDYRNKKIENRKNNESLKFSLRHSFSFAKAKLQSPAWRIKRQTFDEFSEKHLTVSNETYESLTALAGTTNLYDLFMVGSDQVWNHEINGMDSAYLLDFVEDASKKVSFASSFGLDVIPSDLREIYARGLSSFSCLSVRERLGAKLISELTGKAALIHADPVFLTSPNTWMELAASTNAPAMRGRLVSYFLGSDIRNTADSIILNSPLKHMKEVKLAGGLKTSDLLSRRVSVRFDRGPIEFVKSISEASFVLTSSFHATAFAILLDKPFAVILSGNEGKDSRITELLNTFSLSNRAVAQPDELNFSAPSLQTDTHEIITKLRTESVEYLLDMLDSK